MLIQNLKFLSFFKIKFSKQARLNFRGLWKMNILKTLIILIKTCYDRQG